MMLRVVMAALALCCEPQADEVEIAIEVEVVEFVEPLHVHADRGELPPVAACRSTACTRSRQP